MLTTLGAIERRLLARRAQKREVQPEPEPTPVPIGRATLIGAAQPFQRSGEADAWLAQAGEAELEADLNTLNRALQSFRVVSADPYLPPLGRHHVLVARIGYGLGEEVADGRWTQARELITPEHRQRRARVLSPQARLAALLGDREQALACEELALRARLDVDAGRWREAALQVMVALDAALAELPGDPTAAALAERIEELRGERDRVAQAAQAALEGQVPGAERQTVEFALGRIEAALRARLVARP